MAGEVGSGKSALPLVLAVNCLHDCELEREILRDVARVESITGFSRAHLALINQAKVVVVLSLNDLSSAAQKCLGKAELVVCIGSGNPQLEAAIAEDLRIQRLVHVNVQLVDEAADTTLALILALLRRTHVLASCCQRGIFAPSPALLRGARRCAGLTLGLLGLDNVALAVAQRAVGFGFHMSYFDPLKERDQEEAAEWAQAAEAAGLVPAASVEELLQSSDVISLHCAPCEETCGLLNAATVAHFKEGALLVNTSSGELMEEDALRCALLSGALGGAALDAVDGIAWFEAWVRDMPNLIMTPRCACYSDQAFMEQRTRGGSVIRRFLKDGALKMYGSADESEPGSPTKAGYKTWNPDFQFQTDAPSSPKEGLSRLARSPQPFPEPTQPSGPDNAQQPTAVLQGDPGATGVPGEKTEEAVGGDQHTTPEKGCDAAAASETEVGTEARGPGPTEAVPVESPPYAPATPGSGTSGEVEERGCSVDEQSDPGETWVSSVDASPRTAGAMLCVGNVVVQPKYLVEGMVVALRDAGGLSGVSRAASEAPQASSGSAEGLFYGLRYEADRKGWKLDTVPGLTQADPATHLVVQRHKDYFGFRSGLAEGRMVQLTKKAELHFNNHNFGAWESWTVEAGSEGPDATVLTLRNKRWKADTWMVNIVVVGEIIDGLVRRKA